jgi:DNA-binding CsgD family transcriptional regulator
MQTAVLVVDDHIRLEDIVACLDQARFAVEIGPVSDSSEDGPLSGLVTGRVIRIVLRSAAEPEGDPPVAAPRAAHALTPREAEALTLLSTGRDLRRVAQEMGISVHTCRDYVKNVLAKLDAHSQLEAVAKAMQLGLVATGRTDPRN